MTLPAKFDSNCKVNPEHHWKAGESIYYYKNKETGTTLVCNDMTCFLNRGGKIYQPKGDSGSSAPQQTLQVEKQLDISSVVDVSSAPSQQILTKVDSLLVDFDLIEYGVRRHLTMLGDKNPNPAKVGMMIKYIQDEFGRPS